MRQPSLAHRLIWLTCATLGRATNVMVYGGAWQDKLCARAYREGWPRFVPIIDRASAWLHPPDREHCRRCHLAQEREARHARDKA